MPYRNETMEKTMGCCNQAPKGGTGKLSYLFRVMIIMFIVIFMIAALWG
ncbi:hypothetical protein NB600_07125 [Vibrio antiquarius]|nr:MULTISPECIES: hypothetical protein [Vibrio]RCW26447.1 hypothetical protein DET53_101327 [Vibrio parahaemolyticus]MCG6223794.1 hypothetical protein [Vibrio diabolicus]MCR9685583.1 hypothetical protein [Vibrio antiquarius]HDU8575759.1 hypothetical protein [Vibrio diabolicus]HDU8580314.1 hypothetical protein [Vibrio diabolicus]